MNTYIEDRDPGDEDPKQFMLMELERCTIDLDYFMACYGYVKTDIGFRRVVEVNGPTMKYELDLYKKGKEHLAKKDELLRMSVMDKLIQQFPEE